MEAKSGIRPIAVGVGLAVAAVATYFAIRPWHLRWGATAEEVSGQLPGDEIISEPNTLNTTRAVTVHAPVGAVWPWLVQMGTGRAGFYSYDLLDNFGKPSAKRIMPEWQCLRVGDCVPAGPAEGVRLGGFQIVRPQQGGFRVVAIEPEHYLVLTWQGSGDWQHTEPTMSWAFVLEPLGMDRTRLIERIRATGSNGILDAPGNLFLEAGDFVMMREQMVNIKKRAERGSH